MFYLGTIYVFDGAEVAWKIGISMVFILALVWFGDEMGSFVGGASPLVTASTPGWMLRGFGWLVLILTFVVSIGRVIMRGQ